MPDENGLGYRGGVVSFVRFFSIIAVMHAIMRISCDEVGDFGETGAI